MKSIAFLEDRAQKKTASYDEAAFFSLIVF